MIKDRMWHNLQVQKRRAIEEQWRLAGYKLEPLQGETVSPPDPAKPKRGRPRTIFPVSEEVEQAARSKGYRVSKRSDGWVVVPPGQFTYEQKRTFPNATRAWEAAYYLATGKW